MKSFSETWFGKCLIWVWKRVKALFAIAFIAVKKVFVLVEDAITDINGKGEVRVWLAILGTLVIYKLVLAAPDFIKNGKTVDFIAYASLISVTAGFVLTLFGIAKSSLEAEKDKTDPATSLIDQMREKVAKIIAPASDLGGQ